MAPRPNWKGYLKLSLVSCPGRPLPGDHHVRARLLPHPQSRHRQPAAPPVGRRAHRRHRRVRGPGQGLRGCQGRVHPGRGRRDQVGAAREQPHHRHRALRAAAPRSTSSISTRPTILHPTDRVGEEAFAVIRDAMRAEEDGGAGARGAVPARAHRHAGAARQGHHRHQPALRQRGAPGMRATSTRFPDSELPKQMLDLATHIIDEDDGQIRAQRIRGPLRECADRADPLQADRACRSRHSRAAPDQRHQPHGCAARSVEGAGERCEARRREVHRPRKPRRRRRPRRPTKRQVCAEGARDPTPRARHAKPDSDRQARMATPNSRTLVEYHQKRNFTRTEGAARPAQARDAAISSSCTSTPRVGCTTTSAWSSTAC